VRLKMRKLAQVAFVVSGLAVLVAAGTLLHKGPDPRKSPSTAATTPETPWKHDWTLRIGWRTYGVCQGLGGTWLLYFGSGSIDTATSVGFQQGATALALLGGAAMLSLCSVALLRMSRVVFRGAQQAASPNGGPAERLGNSGAGGGPPSVS
jgi:hypothetical protein